MKNKLLIIAYFLISTNTFAQNFEGKISYKNIYKSKVPNIADQQWTSMLGSSQEYFIKNENYKSVGNGTLAQWQLYINSENKLYSKMSNSESAIWNDASVQGDEILKVEINKNILEILGQKCDEIIFTCKSGIQKYYYSSEQHIDAKQFENHKFGNWFDYLSKSNALPLKSVIDNAQFTLESIATEIKPMKLETTIFELPNGIKTIKSPY